MWYYEMQQDEIHAVCDMDWIVSFRQWYEVCAEKIISN